MIEAKSRRRHRKRHLDDDVAVHVRHLVKLGMNPATIRRELMADERFKQRVPSYDTIRRTKADIDREDQSGPWNWTAGDVDPEMVRIVLDTLAAMNFQTGGRVQSFTQQQAERIYLVRTAFPKLPAAFAFMLEAAMSSETGAGDRMDATTSFLAFQPWLDPEHQQRYWQAIRQGWIPKGPPLALSLGADGSVTVTDAMSALRSVFDLIGGDHETTSSE